MPHNAPTQWERTDEGGGEGVEAVVVVPRDVLHRDVLVIESVPLRAVHLSRHKWPGGLGTFTQPSGILGEGI